MLATAVAPRRGGHRLRTQAKCSRREQRAHADVQISGKAMRSQQAQASVVWDRGSTVRAVEIGTVEVVVGLVMEVQW